MDQGHRQQTPSLPADHRLDLRDLPAPEPFERALAAIDASAPGTCIELLTPMLPVPLLRVLASRGLETEAETLDDGSARVRVHC